MNWQFLRTKRYDPADFGAFLELLRAYKTGVALTGKEALPHIADMTSSFVHARLQCSSKDEESGYPVAAFYIWTRRASTWSKGKVPDGLETLAASEKRPPKSCDIFIDGLKPKAPAAAMALIERLAAGGD